VTAAAPGSRAEIDSLLPWARQLYAAGASAGEVMRAIYGVDLPAEVQVLARAHDAGVRLPVDRMLHPWQLLVAADPARQPRTSDPWARRQEEHAFAQHPDFLPLMQLSAPADAEHDRYVIGYDLAALRRGERRVLGHDGDIPASGAVLEPLGDSLLEVMHAWLSDNLRIQREQLADPKNIGFGSIEQSDVDDAVRMVEQIEALQREAAAG
jgi:hypothetical protein